jgi:antibiotic biosynthesis monooxygenase (ABM) superfamily enzyme
MEIDRNGRRLRMVRVGRKVGLRDLPGSPEGEDPMRWWDKLMMSFLIWVCVFPGVLLITYLFRWMGLELDLWVEILLSTALTVPLITVVAAPQVEKLIAAAHDKTLAELKMDQAREAEQKGSG